MKINERNCFHLSKDLVNYTGNIPITFTAKFCKHCGQLWYLRYITDAAGDRDSEYVQFVPTLE